MAKLLADYFLLLHTQDLQLYDRVFHHRANLYGSVQGQLNERSASDYRMQLAERASPQERGFERAEQVLWVDYLSDDLALVMVQLSLYGQTMVDYLNLVNVDGEWRIISKLWARAAED
ncbi:MAG: nuclear transport factor 2 family protein [Alkalimonas sp.]|nr:nuclear transport factor 2 family protein [Alkalimonas sp.]